MVTFLDSKRKPIYSRLQNCKISQKNTKNYNRVTKNIIKGYLSLLRNYKSDSVTSTSFIGISLTDRTTSSRSYWFGFIGAVLLLLANNWWSLIFIRQLLRKCLQSNVIYQATVTTATTTETYFGLATNFRERYSTTRQGCRFFCLFTELNK